MTTISREIRLSSRPEGMPVAANFEMAEVTLPAIKDGEVLVKNTWMSVDPYMRGRMIDRKSYIPPFQVGAVLEGHAVGKVVSSNNDKFAEGDLVFRCLVGVKRLYPMAQNYKNWTPLVYRNRHF